RAAEHAKACASSKQPKPAIMRRMRVKRIIARVVEYITIGETTLRSLSWPVKKRQTLFAPELPSLVMTATAAGDAL
ncbi:MAG TPA: hypothetical protein PKM81_04360, partial [Verrucomicrobiota bacterium]|nr:hypothetical protein [Verrucomicrobiota bacterium]